MKNIALCIFITILLAGCSDNSVNTPEFTINYLPVYNGSWRYQVVDSTMKTIDTVNMFIYSLNINYGNWGYKSYHVYFFKGNIPFDSAFYHPEAIIDSAKILINDRNFSFTMIRANVYPFFDFILNLPLKLNDKWTDKYSGDKYSVDKYIQNYKVFGKNYNVYSINRLNNTAEAPDPTHGYYVNNHIFISDSFGIVSQTLWYWDNNLSRDIKKSFNLIGKE